MTLPLVPIYFKNIYYSCKIKSVLCVMSDVFLSYCRDMRDEQPWIEPLLTERN
jgi:hypothetical protein